MYFASPTAIDRVTRDGNLVFTHQSDQGKQVLDPASLSSWRQIMSNDNNRAMIFGRNSLLTLRAVAVAVKTGTSETFRWMHGRSASHRIS